jgi:hypothetical protein
MAPVEPVSPAIKQSKHLISAKNRFKRQEVGKIRKNTLTSLTSFYISHNLIAEVLRTLGMIEQPTPTRQLAPCK